MCEESRGLWGRELGPAGALGQDPGRRTCLHLQLLPELFVFIRCSNCPPRKNYPVMKYLPQLPRQFGLHLKFNNGVAVFPGSGGNCSWWLEMEARRPLGLISTLPSFPPHLSLLHGSSPAREGPQGVLPPGLSL